MRNVKEDKKRDSSDDLPAVVANSALPPQARIWHEPPVLIRRASISRMPMIHQLANLHLAATAHRHNLTMVTRNVSDFRNTGIKLFNPFPD